MMRGNMSARIAFIPKTTKRLSQAFTFVGI